jgi:GT2 family glycosyltransferase
MSWRPPKILVGAPTADVKNYCVEEWVNNVKSILYPYSVDIFLADNSDDPANVDFLRSLGVQAERVKFKKNESIISRIAKGHNLVSQKALEGDYDFLLHLETDVFPPPEVLINLLSHRKSLAGISYDIFDMHDREPVMIQLEEDNDSEQSGAVIRGKYNYGAFDGTLKQAWANGVGCTLIHKSVLEKVKFRFDKDRDGFSDSWFAYDIRKLGIPMYVDTSMYAYHQNKDWRNFGEKFVSNVHTY